MIKKTTYLLNSIFIITSVLLLALVLRWSVSEIYVIHFQGMMPTLFSNDHVIVNKLAYGLRAPFSSPYISQWSRPKRGDVVVFHSPFAPHSLSIRRVVGLPGDRIFFENGNLYINEQKVVQQIPSKRKKIFHGFGMRIFQMRELQKIKVIMFIGRKLFPTPLTVSYQKEKKRLFDFWPFSCSSPLLFCNGGSSGPLSR